MPNLSKIVNKTHVADLAVVFRAISTENQRILFDLIKDIEQKGALFSELDEDTFLTFIEGMELDELTKIFACMPTDDVADILGRLPEDKSSAILEGMGKKDSEEVEGLLSYDDDTAGGIMVPDFIALGMDVTAQEAIESLQAEHMDVEMPFYLYVVDDYEKLAGVISLRQLVVVPHETPLKKFMATDVISVTTDMDQEEVAKIVAKYNILAVPVVDDNNRLAGIVTVDDVIDIFRLEATEDILRMAGAGEEFIETKSIIKSTRIRFPWLFASCIGGIAAFYIIGHFTETLNSFVYLAAFIPVIMGMGGNIGTQSSTIVVRGLATGRLDVRDIWKVVSKELVVGCILGIIYGTMIGLLAQFRFNAIPVAVSVGAAVISSMSVAALVGSFVPMGFAKINIDPAVATGPFVTTAVDIISVFIYFKIATFLIGI